MDEVTNYFSLGGTTDTVTIGSNNFKSGDFAPNGQGVYDLGDPYARWRRVYVDEVCADKGIDAGNSRVTNVAAPISYHDAATKGYVDEAVGTGTTSFNDITDKHEFFANISYDDIGQFMEPVQSSNYDIVLHDSLTPVSNSTFNLGQNLRRFLFGYFERVRLSGNDPYYDDEAITYEFLRSYVTENAQGTSSWSGITDKPEFLSKLSYQNNLDPENPSNHDIVVSDSITPAAESAYIIGRENRRFAYGYFQRVRVSESPYDDDEAVPYQFMREYVAANAVWSTWSGIRGRPDWTDRFSGDTTTISVGSNLIPNASQFDLGSYSAPWRHIYTVSLTVYSYAYFSGSRIRGVGAPSSDNDAATKKYVDDTETDTRSYVDAQKHDLLSQIDTLSTQAGHIISILAAEMSEEEITFRVIYNEDNNSKC